MRNFLKILDQKVRKFTEEVNDANNKLDRVLGLTREDSIAAAIADGVALGAVLYAIKMIIYFKIVA